MPVRGLRPDSDAKEVALHLAERHPTLLAPTIVSQSQARHPSAPAPTQPAIGTVRRRFRTTHSLEAVPRLVARRWRGWLRA